MSLQPVNVILFILTRLTKIIGINIALKRGNFTTQTDIIQKFGHL
jgi:hypothetical protein